MTQPLFDTGPSPRGNPAQEGQEFVDQVMYWLTAPYVTWPGWEDIYQHNDNKTKALVRRMAQHEEIHRLKACTEFEAMLYLSTATQVAPPSPRWFRIYMYLFQREMPQAAEANGLNDVKELNTQETEALMDLRRWIYQQQMRHLKAKLKGEAKASEAQTKEAEYVQARFF